MVVWLGVLRIFSIFMKLYWVVNCGCLIIGEKIRVIGFDVEIGGGYYCGYYRGFEW